MGIDENLLKLHHNLTEKITFKHSLAEQATIIALEVANQMGGEIKPENIEQLSWQVHCSEKKLKYKSNVVPIGDINVGTFIHRALLFKTLADKIGVPVSLERGNYNLAWNEIMLPHLGEHRAFVVDLMFKVGKLHLSGTAEAEKYKRL